MSRVDLVSAMAASSGWTKASADRALRAFLESVRASL
jgi:nucleoid DNA-binding protein